MNFQWDIFLTALGLALILEGLPYFLGPEAVKRLVGKMLELPPPVLRMIGFTSIAAGLIIVALARMAG